MHLTLLHEQHYLCHRWLTILMLWRKWPAILLVLTHYIILHKVSQFTLHNLQRILFIRFIKASYTITSYNTWYLLRFIKVCFHVYTKYTINKGYCTINFMHLSDLFKISNLTTIDFLPYSWTQFVYYNCTLFLSTGITLNYFSAIHSPTILISHNPKQYTTLTLYTNVNSQFERLKPSRP